jgi:hypothetical protein
MSSILELLVHEIILEILNFSGNLHMIQVSKYFEELFNKYPDHSRAITIKNVYRNNLAKVPHKIISEIANNEKLFVDVFRNNKWSEEGYFGPEYRTYHHDMEFCPFVGFRNKLRRDYPLLTFQSLHSYSKFPDYVRIREQNEFKLENIEQNEKDTFITNLIENEKNIDRLITILNILEHAYGLGPFTSDVLVIATRYAVFKNDFALFKKLEDIVRVIHYRFDGFIYNENIEAIMYLEAHYLIGDTLEHSVIMKSNNIFDLYYNPLVCNPNKTLELIHISIQYNNLYAFRKLLDNSKYDLCTIGCVVNSYVISCFEALYWSCLCNENFLKVYNDIKTKLMVNLSRPEGLQHRKKIVLIKKDSGLGDRIAIKKRNRYVINNNMNAIANKSSHHKKAFR